MVRPTLIVGLGGTGVLICQWVEHYIKELLGCVPPFVRFLKLDTDAFDEGGPPDRDLSDFINLFHHMDVGEVVRDNASYPQFHPHLDWMQGFREDATFADYGCQGIPRLGRLVFVELRETIVHEAVAARFSSLQTSTQTVMEEDLAQFLMVPDGAPAVHLVSSVCGGTGAGMLIDMAYNLRWWSRESFSKSAEIVGHLMLPDAFRVDPMLRPKLEATACATLEQIEFLSDERRPDIPVRYRSQRSGETCFRRDTSPFNFLYLLNGQVDMGSGDRKNLIRMIARVIRTLTLEPLGQQVRSDANNKLAEILPQRDPANNRRQCFCSYGFWYGTPGYQQIDLKSWILSDLQTMGAAQAATYTYYMEEIEKPISSYLKLSPDAGEVVRPTLPFMWEPPGEGSSAEVISGILKYLQAYLEGSVVAAARAEAAKVLPPDQPAHQLLTAADTIIERDVFSGEKLKPLGWVGQCLVQWIGRLGELLETEQSSPQDTSQRCDSRKSNEVIGRIMEDARQALANLRSKIPPLSWTPNDVNPIMDRAIDRHWGQLAKALLRENRVRSIKETLQVFRLRKQAVDSVVSLAAEGAVHGPTTGLPDQGGAEDRGKPKEFFSTPVYATSEPIRDLDSIMAKDFRQNFIKPLLSRTILSITDSKQNAGDVKETRARLKDEMRKLDDEVGRFLGEVELSNWEVFAQPVPTNVPPNDHPYYDSICNIWRLSEPKIDISKSRKYSMPLEVTISQQIANSCVPQLLSHHCKATFREAACNENYRKTTGEWLQMLRLRYGFCLEAVSGYKKYVTATNEYIKRMGFEYSDVWLDRRWYIWYVSSLAEWQEEITQRDREPDRSAYNVVAAKVGSLHRFIQTANERLRTQISSVKDPAIAARMAELRQDAEHKINTLLDSISLNDRSAADERLSRCVNLTTTLVDNLRACADGLSDSDQAAVHQTLGQCQEELAEVARNLGLVSPQRA
jgi:hypothetical protein